MRLILIAALLCAIVALWCAAGNVVFDAAWPVWLCAAVVAFFLDLLVGGRVTVGTRIPPS